MVNRILTYLHYIPPMKSKGKICKIIINWLFLFHFILLRFPISILRNCTLLIIIICFHLPNNQNAQFWSFTSIIQYYIFGLFHKFWLLFNAFWLITNFLLKIHKVILTNRSKLIKKCIWLLFRWIFWLNFQIR